MESLLHYLNKLPSGAYSDKENKQIAEYLTGKRELEKIKPFLKQVPYLAESKSAAREIGREAAKEKELLLRLGRFMALMRSITDINSYFTFITSVASSALSVEEMYVEGGLGADTMLVDVLEMLSVGYHWNISPKALGFESYPAFFATIHEKYPDAWTRLFLSAGVIFSAVYLYTHDQAYDNDDFVKEILTIGATIINMTKKKGNEAFAAAAAEPYFAENPYIRRLEEQVKQESNDGKKANKESRQYVYDTFYFACMLAPSPSELLDLISYILIYDMSEKAFGAILNARSVILGKPDNEEFFRDCLPQFEQGIYPKDRFLAYQADRLREKDRELFCKLVQDNEEAAIKAAAISKDLGSALLISPFWEKGMHLDKVAAFEQKLMKNVSHGKIDSAVRDYFLGKGDPFPKVLPIVDLGSFSVGIAALLSSVSSVPERIFIYAVMYCRQIHWFRRTLTLMREYRGEKAAEDYLDALNIPTEAKLAAFTDSYIDEWNEEEKAWYKKQISRIAGQNRELLEAAFKGVSAKGRAFILETVYKEQGDYKPQWLMECLGDSSKIVRDLAVVYLTPLKQLKEQIEVLTNSKTKAVRECAEKLLLAYNADASGSSGDFNALAYCVQNIPATAAKTIAWTEFETLPKVRMAGTETQADDRIVLGYIYLLVTQTEMALPPGAAKIRESLNKDDLRILGEHLYHIWKKNNAPAKQRGVLVLAAMDADDVFIGALKADIQNWADASRGALAADAVRAMALQGGNFALMTVDAIAKKFNNKQVQRAGEEAFQFAAEQLGVDPEVLGDRIVPNLGFDSRGEQVIDYGSRTFMATINPSLQIELKTAEGKAVKSLPAPGANDDQDKAAAAKAAFSAMKKSLKSVASIQCLRLELALSSNRTWTKEEWAKLFIENPIMNMFAIGLIWGTYDAGGQLISSFRYMEDGAFTSVEDDEVTLDDDAAIGLCHPLDLGDELIAAWTRQLADYEIKQPVEQLSRKVFRLSPDQKNAVAVTEFGGAVMYAVSLLGKLQKLGWRKGSVQDAGGYYNFYKEDRKQGIGVWLNFSGTYVGADTTEEVTIYDAVFYRAGTVQYGSYIYDEIKKEDILTLGDVPPRLYSEVCYDIERATANRISTNADWEKTR